MMSSNEYREAVRLFLKTKPWTVIGHAGRFAIDGLGAERAYAMVTGGNDRSLTLFMNAQAMASYAALVSAQSGNTDQTELDSLRLEQDYLLCQFDEAESAGFFEAREAIPGVAAADTPVCSRMQFACIPRPANEAEKLLLTAALRAASDLARLEDYTPAENGAPIICACLMKDGSFTWKKIMIPEEMEVGYPSPVLSDELALRRLRRKESSGATLSCAIRILPLPLEGDEQRVPIAMVLMDDLNGVVGMPMIMDYETEAECFATEFLSYVEEFGKPALIRTTDARTFCLISGLARQIGIPVEQGCKVPEINEAVRGFVEYLYASVIGEKEPAEKKKTAKNGQGVCLLCEKEYSGSGMTRHIKTCAKNRRKPGDTGYFLIRVCDADDPDFWMYLEVKEDASLKHIDQFLREAWVDCCGHMSVFCIGEEEYFSRCMEEGDLTMSAKLNELLRNGKKFHYEYDFGSPTRLNLQVVDQYTAKNRRKKVELLARNIMPRYACVSCGKPAQMVFRPCGEPIEKSVYCLECAENMEEPMLPLLNSPRTGVCGYGMWLMDDDDDEN